MRGKIRMMMTWQNLVLLIMALVTVGLIIAFVLAGKDFVGGSSANTLGKYKYDIVVQAHEYEYAGVPTEEVPLTGYSTRYLFTVIDSKENKRYKVIYEDIWEVHNKRGDLDKVYLETEDVSGEEVKKAEEQYGKKERRSLRELVEEFTEEIFEVEVR